MTWKNTAVISGDVIYGVSALRERTEGVILVAGSGTLVGTLLAEDEQTGGHCPEDDGAGGAGACPVTYTCSALPYARNGGAAALADAWPTVDKADQRRSDHDDARPCRASRS